MTPMTLQTTEHLKEASIWQPSERTQMSRKHGLGAIAVVFALAALPASGCGEEVAEGLGVGIDNTTQGLAANTIASVDGTYTTCSHRSGAWSVRNLGRAGR